MAERVAVLGLLNKRNGIVRDLTLRPGQAMRVKDAVVRLRACETTAPWENEQLTGAFVQLDVAQPDGRWERRLLGLAVQGKPVAQRRRASGLRRLAQELRDELAGRARRRRRRRSASSNRSSAPKSGGGSASRSAPAAAPTTDAAPATRRPAPATPEPSNAEPSNAT